MDSNGLKLMAYICFRYLKYLQMVPEGLVESRKIPKTQRAAYYNGQIVHLQIIKWKMLDDKLILEPTN